MSEPLTTLELYVLDKQRPMYARAPQSDLDYSDRSDPWEKDSSSVESSRYDVSELEANRSYFGIRGPGRWGPEFIFRTSQGFYEHHTLGKDDLWATIRSKIVELLDRRKIQHSSVDLVRFSLVEENKENDENDEDKDDEDDGDFDFKVAPYGTVVTTLVTIWVRNVPDSLTGEVAFHSSNDILDLLKEHGISDVDVAWSGVEYHYDQLLDW
ncbi:hypothetical protein F5887DRAFT_963016 [Amanita rubescens]|nr:hypothetical protein F5887DRAFT_963016 [Amanita rubescens]